MDDYSHLYCAELPLNNMGVSEQHVFDFEPSKLFSPASAFDHEHQVGSNSPPNPFCSEFPTQDSNISLSQSSQYNFSIDSAGPNFRDTLQSVVKSHYLCSNQSNDMSNPFPHSQNMLLSQNYANQGDLNVCDSSSSREAPSNKKRIKWTQDLHEQFVKTVDHLGGAEKATPKAILKLMNSNLLTILHVKSHLQKYRTSRYIPESLQEKSERRTRANGIPDQLPMQISTQMKEALQMQLEVEMRLRQQLELQQNLQSLIEEELRKLKIMFDQQQKIRYKSLSKTKTKTQNSCPRMTNEQVSRMRRF
ncbi:hypothetical protein SLA2020_378250 [Shorea laevis]